MMDLKKKERFFSSFSDLDRTILTGYINSLSASKADIYLVMARKAACLIEALIDLGILSLNGSVYSERILDLDDNFLTELFKNKKVIVIDDTIVSGTTISDVIKTLIHYGAKSVLIEVITINKKWYTPELLDARCKYGVEHGVDISYTKPVELSDSDSIKFCFDIVKGLSIIPKLYDYDFPRIKLNKWKKQSLTSTFINDLSWKYFDTATILQKENGVCSYTCIPNEHVVLSFDRVCGANLSKIANLKIRFLGYINDQDSYNLTAIPMIIFNSIGKEDINKYLFQIFNGLYDAQSFLKIFSSYTSKLRLLQYILSVKLMNLWLETIRYKANRCKIFPKSEYIDSNVETMLFTELGSKVLSKFDYKFYSPYTFKVKYISCKNNSITKLLNIVDDHIVKAKLIEPFISFYDEKELPCRKAVKEFNYNEFSEKAFFKYLEQEKVEYGRLKHGITFTELSNRISYLEGKYDYITYASVFLDKMISRGIAVPIMQDEGCYLCRAYRHGEDAIMGDLEHRMVVWTLKSVCKNAGVEKLTKITTEKLIALLIKFGVRNEWLDSLINDNQTFDAHKIVVSNKHDLHGMRARVTQVEHQDYKYDPWYTYYLKTKGYIIAKDNEEGYSFNPPDSFNPTDFSKGANDIDSFALVFGKLILRQKEVSNSSFEWQLTKLASCVHPKDIIDALLTEIEIFQDWWSQIKSDSFIYEYFKTDKKFLKAETAVNSGQVKYYSYIQREAQTIIKALSDSLGEPLYQTIFRSFFDMRELDAGQKYHENTIEILGCWLVTINLAIRLWKLISIMSNDSFKSLGAKESLLAAKDFLNKIENNESFADIKKNTFFDIILNNKDIEGKEELFKCLSDVLFYVKKVSSFIEGYNIPKQLLTLTSKIISEDYVGALANSELYNYMDVLNRKIKNQSNRAKWEIINFNNATERKIYKNCLYIKFHNYNSKINGIMDKFLQDKSIYNDKNFPYIIKTQDSIFDSENDICLTFYEDEQNTIKAKIISLIKKLACQFDDIEKLFVMQKLPVRYSIEVIKNNIDPIPLVHTHNLMDFLNEQVENEVITSNWFFEICFEKAQSLKLNNALNMLQFSKQKCIDENIQIIEYKKKKFMRNKITIGIITVLDEEFEAIYNLLQDPYEECISSHGAGHTYTIGTLPAAYNEYHKIALCQCADMGNNMASIKATQLLADFKNIKYVILTGIAAGEPKPNDPDKHVRLGDIVISDKGGIVQYDMIKIVNGEVEHRNINVNSNAKLIEACKNFVRDYRKQTDKFVTIEKPDIKTDVIYDFNDEVIPHPIQLQRDEQHPCIFIGHIGSANILLKYPEYRDEISNKFDIRAFEMEGSGIADASWIGEVGYLVVRGISDYGDTHKNDIWHKYAASVAAIATCEILKHLAKVK